MPRRSRAILGGYVYHVLNRAAGGRMLFSKDGDYDAFERILESIHGRIPLRILAYCLMPTHFHFVVWPKAGDNTAVSEFMRRLTVTHAQRYHAHHGTSGTGPVYQGRYKAFPVQTDDHLHTVVRYVERNPLRARLVRRAQDWSWSSLYRLVHGDAESKRLLSDWPATSGVRPRNWLRIVNQPLHMTELQTVRRSIQRGRPLGDSAWTKRTTDKLGLESAFRPRGRPRKP